MGREAGATDQSCDDVAALSSVRSACTRAHPPSTIDVAPATDDLHATADVVRDGSETSLVDVEVADVDGELVARGTGVYKTSDLPDSAPWDLGTE